MSKVRKLTDKWRLYCRLRKIKTGGKMDILRGLFYGALLVLLLTLANLLHLPPLGYIVAQIIMCLVVFVVERPDMAR